MTAATLAADPVVSAQRRLLGLHFLVGLGGIAVGLVSGALVALDRSGIALDPARFYQGLTLHGVSLVYVTALGFGGSFLSLSVMSALRCPLASRRLVQVSLTAAGVGAALLVAAVVLDRAAVSVTFSPPLDAGAVFYLGAVLMVASVWAASANLIMTVRAWRRDHPRERLPLLAFASLVVLLAWDLATIGIGVELVVFLLPWSLGLTGTVDPLLDRILFWFTAPTHPSFFVLPAAVSWLVLLPHQLAAPRVRSTAVRAVFVAMMVLGVPGGLAAQAADPGVDENLKLLHVAFGLAGLLPLVAAGWLVVSSLEERARRAGCVGAVGWLRMLPWRDPSAAAQLLAMAGFAVGSGLALVADSGTLGLLVKGTAYESGLLHLTMGAGLTLTVMGVAYWLVPHLTGHGLWGRRAALVQPWLWLVGSMVLTAGTTGAGLGGQPAGIPLSATAYADEAWQVWGAISAAGGALMGVAGVLFLAVMVGTLRTRTPATVEVPTGPEERSPAWLDRPGAWLVVAVAAAVVAYFPVFVTHNYELDVARFVGL
jgi:cytochrome c oxidase subunit 1